jgi:putative acyl-CoA dehydrogenase
VVEALGGEAVFEPLADVPFPAHADADPVEAALRRLLTPAAKFWVCKRGPAFAAEAMEVLGGNGYVEEGPLGRIYREMPVNSIWEGSGNVIALDVLRALRRTPDALDAVLAEVRGVDPRIDRHVASLPLDPAEADARLLVEGLALALQAALLVRHAPPFVADAFCASRLDPGRGHEYGTLPRGADCARIVARHTPWLG